MSKIIQYSFYPVMVFGLLAALLYVVPYVPKSQLPFLPVYVLIPSLLIMIGMERWMPFQKNWNENRNDFVTDLVQTFISLPAASQFSEFVLPFLLYIPGLMLFEPYGGGYIETQFSLFWSFIITLLLCEFCYYWMHRFTHKIPKFWRLHEVHHAAERVYWANSGRFHFFDAILGSAAYLLPMILLNTSDRIVIMVLIFSGITGFLEHVNINFRAGYMNYVFNSAELHRWHHSRSEQESNNNYGKVLIVWDLLFGTFFWPQERTISEVGVEGTEDPKGILKQLTFPFRK